MRRYRFQKTAGIFPINKTHASRSPCKAKLFSRQRYLSGPGSSLIQTKLKIGATNDKYEQEADWVTDQLMRVPGPTTRGISKNAHHNIQTKAISVHTPAVTSHLTSGIHSLNGNGQPLPSPGRHFFESRFGYDFSNIRIHTDSRAAETAKSIHARAFTLGNNIVFAAGQYAPGTREGRRLMAHELTHVVQQNSMQNSSSSMIQRMAAPSLGPANVEDIDYDPWQGSAGGRVTGTKFLAATDGGSSVSAWVRTGGPDDAEPLRYWCHGHSLGTYASFGYSVFSGTDTMGRVINDEYRNIYPDSGVRRGDLAVWLQPDIADSPHLAGKAFGHSAIIESPTFDSSGYLDHNSTMLSSKNGAMPLNPSISLTSLEQIYGPDIGYYRKR